VEQYCGEGLLALGERPTAVVSGGAWVAQTRLGRAYGCGAAAQEQRARVAAWSGEQAARERRRSGVRARDAERRFREKEEKQGD